MTRKAALLVAAVLLFTTTASAQQSAEDASVYGYGDIEKTCREWTDICRTCTRSDTGAVVCPNIGIACQPQAIACVKRIEAAKPGEPASEKNKP